MMTIAIPPRPEGRGILAKKSDEECTVKENRGI